MVRTLIDGNLFVVGSKAVAVGVGVGTEPALQHFVWRSMLFFMRSFWRMPPPKKEFRERSFCCSGTLTSASSGCWKNAICLRNQVFNLCELKKKDFESDRLQYEAGSIETLKNLVDHHNGITILPFLATLDLTKKQKAKIREFAPPSLYEINLVVNKNFHHQELGAMNQEPLKKKGVDYSAPVTSIWPVYSPCFTLCTSSGTKPCASVCVLMMA